MSAYYNEIDPYAAQWLRNLIEAGHIAPGVVDERSIEDVKPDELMGYTQCHFFAGVGAWSLALRRAGWPDNRPVWTGSCPCQPFSSAGAGLAFADPRHLWPSFAWLIKQCAPPVIIGEQVASKAVEPWVDLVQADLEALGYAFGAVPFPSAGVGAPHIRDRLYWVADADSVRRPAILGESYQGMDRRTYDQRTFAGFGFVIQAGGLADNLMQQRPRRQPGVGNVDDAHGRIESAAAATGLCGDMRPGPTNGFWRSADWLGCRDGTWRPVEPIHVKMVDGDTGSMGHLRAGPHKAEENVNDPCMSILPKTSGEEDLSELKGVLDSIQKEEVLRSEVHGPGVRGTDKGHEPKEQQEAVRENPRHDVRSLLAPGAPCSSPERKSPGQHAVELDDVVRLLSPSMSLSELYGDRGTIEFLQALRARILQAWPMPNTPKPLQEIWSSLGEEEKDRIGMGFDASRWVKVDPFPLAIGEGNRVGRLRAYGNAINAQAAQEFIAAYLESTMVN